MSPTAAHATGRRRGLRRVGTIAVLLALVASFAAGIAPPPSARADDLSDALARQKALQKQIKNQKAQVAELNDLQDELKARIASTAQALKQVNADLAAVRRNIEQTEDKIDVIRAGYVSLSREIDEQSILIERTIRSQWRRAAELAERRALLADRIRASYATGQTSLLETILSGDSFTDVLSEAAYYLDVGQQDKALAQEISRRAEILKLDQAMLDESRAQSVELRVEKEKQKDALDTALADLKVARAQLKKLEKDTARALAQQKSDYSRLKSNEAALRKSIAQRQRAQQKLASKIEDLLAKQYQQGNIPSVYNGTLAWPMVGVVTQEYGCTGFGAEPPKGSCAHFHSGIDIAAPMYTPIRAAGSGTVLFAGPNPYDPYPKAWIVIIAHSQNLLTWYGHVDNAVKPPRVRAGQSVNKGDIIAYNGLTGRTTGPHLHWMVEFNDDFVNPRLFV